MFKKVLVPTDGSPLSDQAIDAAVAFAGQVGAGVIGISVAEPYPLMPASAGVYAGGPEAYEERARESALSRVARINTLARAAGIPCEIHVAVSDDPYREIVNAAQQFGCDLIFMASHGRKGLGRLSVGSETQKVLAHAPVPVMVYR